MPRVQNLSSGFCRDLSRHFTGFIGGQRFTAKTISNAERMFHPLHGDDQFNQFTSGLGDLLSPIAEQMIETVAEMPDPNLPTITNQRGTKPIVTGFLDGVDFVFQLGMNRGKLEVQRLDIDRGGIGSCVATGFRNVGVSPDFPVILGHGDVSDLYIELLDYMGVSVRGNVMQELDENRDGYIHPCLIFNKNGKKYEHWFAPKRFEHEEGMKFLIQNKIRACCEANSGEPLVLTAIPPNGTGDDFKASVLTLFSGADVALAKPNITEFVMLLRYSEIIKDSDSAQKEFINKLTEQVKRKSFKETINLARALMSKHGGRLKSVLISFSEHPALFVTKDHAAFAKPPKTKLISPSGAGDSGLAALLAFTRSRINLNDLDKGDLPGMLRNFVLYGSLTAGKEGSEQPVLSEAKSFLKSHGIDAGII